MHNSMFRSDVRPIENGFLKSGVQIDALHENAISLQHLTFGRLHFDVQVSLVPRHLINGHIQILMFICFFFKMFSKL